MRVLLVVLVLIALIAGAGFYLGWYDVKVQEDKIDRDLAAAKEEARDLGRKAGEGLEELSEEASELGKRAREKAKVLADTKTARGQVEQVAGENIVLRTDDNETLTVHTDATTKLERAGQKIDAVAVGDRATVAYQVRDGKNHATSVTVDRK
jgi:uncharacterized protein HemX